MLIDESESKSDNHWRLDFRQGLFNTTSHSSLSRTAAQLADAFDGAEDLDQPYHSNPLCVSTARTACRLPHPTFLPTPLSENERRINGASRFREAWNSRPAERV